MVSGFANLIEVLLKRDLKMKSRVYVENLKQNYTKYGGLTSSQTQVLSMIAKESGLVVETKSSQVSFKPREVDHSIFTDEERKELWQYVRQVMAGKISRAEAVKYAAFLQEHINNKKKEQGRCLTCTDGYVFAVEKDNTHAGETVFKCFCGLGSTRPEPYNTWSEAMGYRYEIS